MARLFIAALVTETNSFAPFPTGRSAFEENGITRDGSAADPAGPLALFRRMAEAEGLEVIESISTFAQPGGRVVGEAYRGLRDAILADCIAAGPLDMVLLQLHGAMMAEDEDDCEGDLLARMRNLLSDAVIGAVLDCHCHLTPAMVRAADCLIAVKEYPHIDFAERAAELFTICNAARQSKMRPVPALVDTGMIGIYPTFAGPMRALVDGLHEIEQRTGILSATIAHGFPWGDTADTGTRVLCYADGDAEAAAATAQEIAASLIAARESLRPDYPDIATSLDRAAALEGPVVLADHADNPGGGAPGDSTFFLAAVLERGLRNVAIASFHDPAVVRIADDAGVGARIAVRLGGKTGPTSGDPLDLEVEVMAITRDLAQMAIDVPYSMGSAVWLRHAGVDIVVCAKRAGVFATSIFEDLGIRLAERHIVIVKSSSHHEAAYNPIARHTWKVATPGALDLDFTRLAYQRRARDFHPLVDPPPPAQLIDLA
ncbi:M81 family metallopeptidase [Erythrobacter sp. BLCC-B19]|uniref:M81 family metallopeptidase n=1 Tax=Erythrobacter sp. BLCC-B19 TaxID=3025315 RepID=UPI00235E39A2|nr:M81 family metallopeptidase [Erythrobacter sp. BLCC-B19]WDA41388.1 M81 family metallopeptidase [Erythrobacter sp. BLCC-B19]